MLITNFGTIASVGGVGAYATLTIDSTLVDAELIDYPVMVKLDSTNFDFTTYPSTDVIYFIQDETMLDHEVELFDATNEIAVFHVRIPTVSAISNTEFELMTDGTGYSSGNNPTSVWDDNFVGVYHMGDSISDSTINGNDGTINGTVTTIDGLNGKASSFNGSSVDLDNGQALLGSGSLTNTVQTVHKPNASGSDMIMVGGQQVTNERYYYGVKADTFLELGFGGTAWTGTGTVAIDTDYQLLSMRVDSGVPKLYKNTTLAYTGTTDTNVNFGTDVFSVGGYYYMGSFDAPISGVNTIDEFRISNIARSDEWIKADYYNLIENTLISLEVL